VYRVVTVRNPTGTLIAIVCALLIAAIFGACGSKNEAAQPSGSDSTSIAATEGTMESEGENFGEGEGQGEGEESKKQQERSTSVRASRAFTGDLVKPVVAEGTIRARHSAEIRVEVGGKITRLFIEEGRPVRSGQLIAKVDDRGYRAAADEARARYLQALSLLSIEDENPGAPDEETQAVRDELANLEKLERSGKITPEERQAREIELDVQGLKEGKFRTEIAAARSGVSVARTALERARLDLERTEIRVPFDGVITGLKLSVGQLVTVGETSKPRLVCSRPIWRSWRRANPFFSPFPPCGTRSRSRSTL
jgi:multidrug efflux pump subunit AcrA (membrane-fusion protein)